MIQRHHAALASAARLVAGCTLYADVPVPPPPAPPPVEPAPEPVLGPTPTLEEAPPPLSGGTLAVSAGGAFAVAADPDRARVYAVDLGAATSRAIPVAAADEPGRVVFDGEERAWVAMRRSGDVAEIDVRGARIVRRIHTCAAPRSVAVDAAAGELWVACAEGSLRVFDRRTGILRRMVDGADLDDLRDVALGLNRVYVTRFRSAEMVTFGRDLVERGRSRSRAHRVAWRMRVRPRPTRGGDGVEETAPVPILVAQETSDSPTDASYAGSENGAPSPVIRGGIHVDGEHVARIPEAVLPVDFDLDASWLAVVAAGNGHSPSRPAVLLVRSWLIAGSGLGTPPPRGVSLEGQPVAVAFDRAGRLLVQSREPAALFVVDPETTRVTGRITLAVDSREDTGWSLFHANPGSNLACASCHPEGGDDGRVWDLAEGRLRTPSLRGTVRGTAPLHWRGELPTAASLVRDVFEHRMGGRALSDDELRAAARWVEAIPAPPPRRERETVPSRGREVFAARCASCHSGALLTNNRSVELSAQDGALQVPSLVGVGWRAPFRHDGCAQTLEERFVDCRDPAHDVDVIGRPDLGALVGYLETL